MTSTTHVHISALMLCAHLLFYPVDTCSFRYEKCVFKLNSFHFSSLSFHIHSTSTIFSLIEAHGFYLLSSTFTSPFFFRECFFLCWACLPVFLTQINFTSAPTRAVNLQGFSLSLDVLLEEIFIEWNENIYW